MKDVEEHSNGHYCNYYWNDGSNSPEWGLWFISSEVNHHSDERTYEAQLQQWLCFLKEAAGLLQLQLRADIHLVPLILNLKQL